MKTLKVGTEVRVVIGTASGDRVKHGIVTEVIDQDHLNVRVGRTPFYCRRGSKFFDSPHGDVATHITPHSAGA